MDYQAESKRLEEFSGDYWKPKAGQYKIKALSEVTDLGIKKFKENEEGSPRAEMQIQIVLSPKIDDIGKKLTWEFPKGKTKASTYGQLIKLGSLKGNLTNVEFTVVVVGEGENVRYTIVV